MNGKGSVARRVDKSEYSANYDRIFKSDSRGWGFAHVKDAEHWVGAEATSREAVIAEADDYFEGPPFAICRRSSIDVEITLPSPDDIVEQMAENAGDNYGWIEDFPDVTQAALDELGALMRAWVRKHVDVTALWQAEDIEEIKAEK